MSNHTASDAVLRVTPAFVGDCAAREAAQGPVTREHHFRTVPGLGGHSRRGIIAAGQITYLSFHTQSERKSIPT